MTSNIGQEEFSKKAAQIGFNISECEEEKVMHDFEKAENKIKDSLTDYFSPEFLNRIDKVLVFRPLDTKALKKIIKIQLEKLCIRLATKNIKLHFPARLITVIAEKVYNPEF